MKRQIILGPDTPLLRLGGRPPRVVRWLLVQQVGVFVLYAFADGPAWVARTLAASAEQTLTGLRLWQPLTALFVPLDARGVVYNSLLLWLLGSALERWWGGPRLLKFWVATGAAGLLAGVLAGVLSPATLLTGASGSTAGMLLAAAVIFPRHLPYFAADPRKGVLPLKVRPVCLLLLGFLAVGNLLAAHYLELAVQAGGALCALLFLFSPGQLRATLQRRGAKNKFGVIEGGKGSGEGGYLN